MTILMADDDEDDRFLVREALSESRFDGILRCVEDGEEIMEYLHRCGRYAGHDFPQPDLVLLDLNMPRKDGREVLREMKSDPHLRRIPVVVFTTSKAEEDILRTYDLGVSSFIIKPSTFDKLVIIMTTLNEYWAKTVKLPQPNN
jgi:CheY-like chemotaxis protein